MAALDALSYHELQQRCKVARIGRRARKGVYTAFKGQPELHPALFKRLYKNLTDLVERAFDFLTEVPQTEITNYPSFT